MVLKFLMRKEEEIRTRIHSFRMPIRDWRARWLVSSLYFLAPIVGGCLFMPLVMPNPEDMREKLVSKLSEEDLARIQEERNRLQAEFDAARQAQLQARQAAAAAQGNR